MKFPIRVEILIGDSVVSTSPRLLIESVHIGYMQAKEQAKDQQLRAEEITEQQTMHFNSLKDGIGGA